MIDKPGLYPDIDDRIYHADPVATPSLSSGVARLLVGRSPMHARHAHPRFVEQEETSPSRAKEIGTVAHKLWLLRGREIKVIRADDYRTKAAQAERAAAYAAGACPILAADYERAEAISAAIAGAVIGTEAESLFYPSEQGVTPTEATLIWQDGEAWCRARPDIMPLVPHGHVTLVDLKTVSESAHPLDWNPVATGADIQEAFYCRGIMRLFPEVLSCRMLFVVCEQDAPHGVSVNQCSNEVRLAADETVHQAIELWAECLRTNQWPGYAKELQSIDAPAWSARRSEMRRLDNVNLLERMRKWQAPL